MTAQSMKNIFENAQYLEVMESKTRAQIEDFSQALFSLYQANSESMNRENVFRLVQQEG